MTLQNRRGNERNFKLLLKINHQKHNYLVYEDEITRKLYSGKKEKNKLIPLEKEEEEYLNKVLERVMGI